MHDSNPYQAATDAAKSPSANYKPRSRIRWAQMVVRVVLAAGGGIFVSVGSGAYIVWLKGPVFHWEMAGMAVVVVCGVLGGIIGIFNVGVFTLTNISVRRRGLAGACVGAGLGLAVGLWLSLNSSATNPRAPEGLVFWIVVMMAIAGCLSGFVGGVLARPSRPE